MKIARVRIGSAVALGISAVFLLQAPGAAQAQNNRPDMQMPHSITMPRATMHRQFEQGEHFLAPTKNFSGPVATFSRQNNLPVAKPTMPSGPSVGSVPQRNLSGQVRTARSFDRDHDRDFDHGRDRDFDRRHRHGFIYLYSGHPYYLDGYTTYYYPQQPGYAGAALLTLNNIIGMASQGLSDDQIISEMQRTGSVFYLTVEDITFLKNNGVSDRVINYMLSTGKRT